MTSFLPVVMSSSCCMRNCQECGKQKKTTTKNTVSKMSLTLDVNILLQNHDVFHRMVRNISRSEEGRVLSEDLHRILGETSWEPIRKEARCVRSHPVLVTHLTSAFIQTFIGLKHISCIFSSSNCDTFTSECRKRQNGPQKMATTQSTFVRPHRTAAFLFFIVSGIIQWIMWTDQEL